MWEYLEQRPACNKHYKEILVMTIFVLMSMEHLIIMS